MSQAWYHRRGLRFGCTRCNDCCRRAGDVHFDDDEAERIAARIAGASAASLDGTVWSRDFDGRWRVSVPDGGACPLLGVDGCTVHDLKPLQCSTYPFWPEVIERRLLWRHEARWCEGIDASGAAHYDGDTIDRIVAEQARTRENDDTGRPENG